MPGMVAVYVPSPASASPPAPSSVMRSEEHTSELQSLRHLVCRLLLEKKKKQQTHNLHIRKNTNTDSTTLRKSRPLTAPTSKRNATPITTQSNQIEKNNVVTRARHSST